MCIRDRKNAKNRNRRVWWIFVHVIMREDYTQLFDGKFEKFLTASKSQPEPQRAAGKSRKRKAKDRGRAESGKTLSLIHIYRYKYRGYSVPAVERAGTKEYRSYKYMV